MSGQNVRPAVLSAPIAIKLICLDAIVVLRQLPHLILKLQYGIPYSKLDIAVSLISSEWNSDA